MKNIHYKVNKEDFTALMELLGPMGPLLEHINRLQSDPFLRYSLPKKVYAFTHYIFLSCPLDVVHVRSGE